MAADNVEIRMYNMGFGDAFRITVRRGDATWRMLVDCGVHAHGQARPVADSVKKIIDDLAEDCGGTPHLDVVVGTHHHRDHIVGFADDRWADVEVDEVWVPFVENDDDPDAKRPTRSADADRAEARGVDRRSDAAVGRQSDRGEAHARAGEGDGGQLTGQRKGYRPPAGSQRHDLRQATARRALPSRQRLTQERHQSAPVRGGGAHLRSSSRPGDSEEDGPAEDGRMVDAEPGRCR